MLLHKGDFVMLESQNGVWLTQQMWCIRILFHDCSMIKMTLLQNLMLSCNFLNDIGFFMMGSLLGPNPFRDAAV